MLARSEALAIIGLDNLSRSGSELIRAVLAQLGVRERIANAAMEMFASACVMSRLDSELQGIGQNGAALPGSHQAGELFLNQSFRRIRHFLADLSGNNDRALLATADAVLNRPATTGWNGR